MSDLPQISLCTSQAFTWFSFVNFAVAGSMMAGGIFFLEASFTAKGFYAMAALMLVRSTVGITKAIRDKEEFDRLHNKLEKGPHRTVACRGLARPLRPGNARLPGPLRSPAVSSDQLGAKSRCTR